MIKLLKRNYNDKKAFTLVELLAVIVILAIILALVGPSVSKIIEDAARKYMAIYPWLVRGCSSFHSLLAGIFGILRDNGGGGSSEGSFRICIV